MIAVRKDKLQSLLGPDLKPLKWAVLDLKRKDALYIMHHPELDGGQQPKCFNCYLVLNTQGESWTQHTHTAHTHTHTHTHKHTHTHTHTHTALHDSCGTRKWYRPRRSRLWCGFSCQVSQDRNADDWEDPGEEMSCGNVSPGQVEVAGVSAYCGLLDQLCWGPQTHTRGGRTWEQPHRSFVVLHVCASSHPSVSFLVSPHSCWQTQLAPWRSISIHSCPVPCFSSHHLGQSFSSPSTAGHSICTSGHRQSVCQKAENKQAVCGDADTQTNTHMCITHTHTSTKTHTSTHTHTLLLLISLPRRA